MAEWLSRMMSKVGVHNARAAVREALHAALRNRCKVYVESPDQGIVALTQVQQIEGDEIVVAVPSIGGMTYPLAFGENLKLSFVDERTNLSGQTRCLGRVKVTAGDGKTLFAYRVALPEAMIAEDRRTDARVELAFEIAPEAHLYSGRMPAPILGRITNISMSGARITTVGPARGVAKGQELYLKFMLPEPVGLVDEVVEVHRIESDARNNRHCVGVSFHRRLERLALLMRSPAAPEAVRPITPEHQRRRSA